MTNTEHELNTIRTTVINAFHHATYTHIVRRMENGRAVLFGRYRTAADAEAAAARSGGWVESVAG